MTVLGIGLALLAVDLDRQGCALAENAVGGLGRGRSHLRAACRYWFASLVAAGLSVLVLALSALGAA